LWRAAEGGVEGVEAGVAGDVVALDHLASLSHRTGEMVAGFVLSEGEGTGLVARTDGLDLGQLVAPGHSLAGLTSPDDGHIVPHHLLTLLLEHVSQDSPDQ